METVTIELRQAKRSDIVVGLDLNKTLIFWLKSEKTGEFDGPYSVFGKITNRNELTFKSEFRVWYDAGMVWVRKSEFEED